MEEREEVPKDCLERLSTVGALLATFGERRRDETRLGLNITYAGDEVTNVLKKEGVKVKLISAVREVIDMSNISSLGL